MILDLTNTERYYPLNRDSKNGWSVGGMKHVKANLPGHGEYVGQTKLEKIFRHIIRFENENPGMYVGVHCTHGFNRTGLVYGFEKFSILHKLNR